MTCRRGFLIMLGAGLVGGLGGCGYRLAGTRSLPAEIKRVSLQGTELSGPMVHAFRAELGRSSAQWVDQTADADVVVVVEDYSLDRRAMVIGPGGAVEEYEIRAELAAHFRYPQQANQEPKRGERFYLNDAQSVDYDRDAVLASSSNQAEIERAVAERIGRLLFYRLYSATPA